MICIELCAAYGRSGIPASTDDHFPYSKRAMAKELVEVMDKLGFPTFTLIGHDREDASATAWPWIIRRTWSDSLCLM